MEDLKGSELNAAKVRLADEATAMLHGGGCLEEIHMTVGRMYAGTTKEGDTSSLPLVKVFGPSPPTLAAGLVALGFATSKRDAKRLIEQGGVKLNGVKAMDQACALVGGDFLDGGGAVVRCGKKRAGVLVWEK